MRRLVTAGFSIAMAFLVMTYLWQVSLAHPDQNNDGFVSIGDIAQVIRSFGQPVPTASPTASAASTPTPTPTRVPGMLDVELDLSVSASRHRADDLQPFAITITMYNHGDNPSPEMVYALIETSLEEGGFPAERLDATGPDCYVGFNVGGTLAGYTNGTSWITQGLNHSGNRGLQTIAPGMAANDQGTGAYRLNCHFQGYWTKDGGIEPLTQTNRATITVSLRDANGDPLIDGNQSNNVDVEVVELVVP